MAEGLGRERPLVLSVGSAGHPRACGGPCKYHSRKAGGCKDGHQCARCHLCVWHRSAARAAAARRPPSRAGGHSAEEAWSAGQSTPDAPSVRRQAPCAGSDGLPGDAETPPEAGDDRAVPRLEIAEVLRSKLQAVEFGQEWQAKADGAASFGNGLPARQELPQTWDMRAPPPCTTGNADAVDSSEVPPPPGLPHPAVTEAPAEPEENRCVILSVDPDGHPAGCCAPLVYARREDCSTALAGLEEDRRVILSVGPDGRPASCCTPRACARREGRGTGRGKDAPAVLAYAGRCMGPAPPLATAAPLLQMAGSVQSPAFAEVTVGTIGHPYSCAGVGCKYSGKARGCKDGRFCIRCHLCQWRRHEKVPPRKEKKAH